MDVRKESISIAVMKGAGKIGLAETARRFPTASR